MSMEGPPDMPPQEPEKIEREPLTDEQCLEAMKAGNFEKVREWNEQEQKESDKDPSGMGRTQLQLRLGRMQEDAGFTEEALETYRAVSWDLEGIYRDIPEGDPRKDEVYEIWEKTQVAVKRLESR